MENVVFFDGNMLEALGKQPNQGSINGSSKNHTRNLSRDSTQAKLPALEGKPPAVPFQVSKQPSSETLFVGLPKKVTMGGSAMDVNREANDIIEEFKKEEEAAAQKYLVKRNSHSAAINIINIGIPTPLANINNRDAKRNNYALQGKPTNRKSMSQDFSKHNGDPIHEKSSDHASQPNG